MIQKAYNSVCGTECGTAILFMESKYSLAYQAIILVMSWGE